ncbi:MAG: DUF642 domain-containing protein [Luteolibacter sp.]
MAFSTDAQSNGSFELDFSGWTSTGNLEIKSAAPYVATNGTKLVAFNAGQATPNGVVSQTFATTVGVPYVVAFDAGALGTISQQRMQLTVAGASTLVSQTITVNAPGGSNSTWVPQSFTFVANSTTTTMSFADVSTVTNSVDLLLDNVRVTAQVPRTLTVASAPTNGVSVTLSPADLNGASGAPTGFSRQYLNGTVVTLTAPSTSGTNTFVKWQRNGVDITTSTGTTVTLDADYTLNAIYSTTGTQLLANGSFESGFTGWTPTGNQEIKSASPYVATDGTKLVSFNGGNLTPNAVLSQTIATTSGVTYTLAFDAGILSYNTNPQKLQVTATGSSVVLTQVVTLSALTNGASQWFAQNFTFVANSSSTVLTFRDQSASTAGLDLLLDNVRLTGPGGPVNNSPVAVADSYTTSQNTPLVVSAAGVLSNDTDAESNPLTPIVDASPAHGSVTLNPNGSFTYTPTSGYNGADSFTYHDNDGTSNSNIATVSITVSALANGALANGSFESGEAGWTMTGNRLVYASDGSYVATDGTNMLVLSGGATTPNAVISQSFSTTPGQSYTLTFDMGALGFNTAEQRVSVDVTGGASVLSQTASVNGNGAGTSAWTTKTFTFTADSTTSVLTFTDTSPTSSLIDLLLDKVAITLSGSAPVTRTLTVTSTPATGVGITVSPNDNGSNGNGTTQFTRTYNDGAAVSLTAPATFGSTTFSKWQKDGADFSVTAATSVTLGANTTMTAVYITPVVPPAGLVNGSFESGETGWTMTGNRLVYASDGSYVSTDGTNMLVLSGGSTTPNAVISQTFATTPGQAYTLMFDMGVLGFNTAEQRLQVTATGNASLLSQTQSVFADGSGHSVWTAKVLSFVADSSSTTLSFTDTSPTSSLVDLLLDNIRITAGTGRVLTVASSPANGVSVTISPNDLGGNGNGVTQISRNYADAAVVTLTAPATSGTDSFVKWQKDSVDFSSNATATVTMDANHTLTAVYGSAPAGELLVNGSFENNFTGWSTTGNIGIQSASPYFPTDLTKLASFNGSNSTPNGVLSQTFATVAGSSYTLTFNAGALAYNTSQQKLLVNVTGSSSLLSQTLTLGGVGGGNNNWTSRSFTFVANSATTTLSFTDTSTTTTNIDLILDKVSVTGAPGTVVTRTLTVASAPANGVSITVTPNDLSASGNGTTQFTRSYNDAAVVSLTAPASFGTDTFVKWQKDGVDFGVTAATSVTMDANHTMTAVYATAPVVAVTLVNGSFENDFTGWTTTGNVAIQSAAPYAPTQGTKLASFNSGNTTPNGVLSQAFATTPGVTYTLAFDAGTLAYNTSQQKVLVTVAGSSSLLSQTVTITGVSGTTKWTAQSFTFVANSATTTLSFTDTSTTGNGLDLVLDNVRVTGPQIQRTLTIASSPANGATVTVSPVDLSSNGSGATPLTRTYFDGSVVSLTAPAVSGANTFIKWQKDGVDSSVTPATSVTMDANHTMTAVYIANLAPVAVADSYSTNKNTALVVPAAGVLTNDSDPELATLTAIVDVNPTHGTLTLDANGGFSYTPAVNYTGSDSFTYHANDGTLNSAIATVSISVNSVVALPFANGSFESGETSWTMSGNHIVYDADATYSATNGTKLLIMGGGNVTPDAVVSQTFLTTPGQTYALTFDAGVLGGNGVEQRLQVAVNGTASLVSQTLSLLGNGSSSAWAARSFTFVADSASTVLTFSDVSTTSNFVDLLLDNVRISTVRTLTVASTPATGLAVTVTPNDLDSNGNGTTQFVRSYADGSVVNLTAPATSGANSFVKWQKNGADFSNTAATSVTMDANLTLTAVYVTNTAPVAVADSYSVNHDTPLVVAAATGVLSNDTDAESNPLTAIVDANPTHGDVTLNANGGFTYTPAASYAGPDSFTYHANDGGLNSNVVTVSINVIPPGLLTNGSFESGETGWTMTGNRIVYGSDGNYNATDGTQMLVLNGGGSVPNAVVSQTFSTVIGQSYTLSLDVGVLSLNTAQQSLLVSLTGNSSLLAQVETLTGNGSGTSVWTPKSYNFVADSTSTTLTLSDLSPTSSLIDLLVDNVKVVAGAAGPPNRTLTVASSPSNGVSVTVSPADLNSSSDGVTQFTRSYADAAVVSLTAPATSGTDTFSKWQKDGVDFSVTAATSVTMDADHTMTAIYQPIASGTLVNGSFESDFTGWTTTGNVFIQSAAPYAPTDGAKLASFNAGNTTPNGVISQAFATTPGVTYTLAFDAGTLAYNTSQQKVLVTVAGSSSLLSQTVTITGVSGTTKWTAQSFTFVANSATTTLSFTDTSTTGTGLDLVLDNVRVSAASTQRTLTVASTPVTGVSVTVSPNDLSSLGNGTTQFTRSYGNGVVVSLTAPASSGTSTFTKWQKDGVDYAATAATTVTMDANHTMTAVYTAPVSSDLIVNGSFESNFTGWTTANNVSIQAGSPYLPTDGTKLAGFNTGNSTPNGVLSQTITTVSGSTYTLAFNAGALAYNTQQQKLQVSVTGSSSLLSQVITLGGIGGGSNNWTTQSFVFTANSTSTTITFSDASTATIALDMVLDKVSVKAQAVPNPGPTSNDSVVVAAPTTITPTPQALTIPPSTGLGTPSFISTPEVHTIGITATEPGTYSLERSEDLQTWDFQSKIEVTEPGPIEFQDTDMTKVKMFYRIGFQAVGSN